MKRSLAALALVFACLSASAAVTYEAARKLTDQMQSVVMSTQSWHSKPLADRIAAYRRADVLVADAERMFGTSPAGTFASCWRAAISMKFYVINLNDMALLFEGRKQLTGPADLFAPMYASFEYGDAYRTCKDQIETLDVPAIKPRK